MPRLIDADALMADVRKNSESYFADDFAHEWVDKQPTIDAVPVVRCRECKFYKTMFCEMDTWTVDVTIYDAKPDDYCSRGQCREDGDA